MGVAESNGGRGLLHNPQEDTVLVEGRAGLFGLGLWLVPNVSLLRTWT